MDRRDESIEIACPESPEHALNVAVGSFTFIVISPFSGHWMKIKATPPQIDV